MLGAILFLAVGISIGYIADTLSDESGLTDGGLAIIFLTIMSPLLSIGSALFIFFTKKK